MNVSPVPGWAVRPTPDGGMILAKRLGARLSGVQAVLILFVLVFAVVSQIAPLEEGGWTFWSGRRGTLAH
jgi:hypothetical protein